MLAAAFAAALSLSAVAVGQACELRLLGLDDAAEAYEGVRATLVEPGPSQRQVVAEAAPYLTSLHCLAVEKVAFVADPGDESGTMGWVYVTHDNDTLYIDARPARASEEDLDPARRPRIVGNVWATAVDTVVHEATHAAVRLLHTQVLEGDCFVGPFGCDEPTDPSQWEASAVAAAAREVERLRLRSGFLTEWTRLHDAFVEAGMAREYGGRGSPSASGGAAAIAAGGFMTPYGSTLPGEDVAEMVAKAQTQGIETNTFAGVAVSSPPEDFACQALRAAGASLTGATAAAYTKLALLRDVGLVDEDAFARCVGSVGIDTRDAEGAHFFGGDTFERTFGDLEVTMGRHAATGRTVFQLEASGRAGFGGAEHPAELLVRLDLADEDEPIDRVSWPRGIYRLGTGANRVSLTLDGASAGSFVASHGFVLVTTATAERIEGSIVLQRADRPFAPMGVPYAADELPRITFRVDGTR
ncbi:MAG: hypothetical protein U5J97_07565 [Trueperaceae bacterium]|nr:hypothetical protein [Trueperaceae bacterium]